MTEQCPTVGANSSAEFSSACRKVLTLRQTSVTLRLLVSRNYVEGVEAMTLDDAADVLEGLVARESVAAGLARLGAMA